MSSCVLGVIQRGGGPAVVLTDVEPSPWTPLVCRLACWALFDVAVGQLVFVLCVVCCPLAPFSTINGTIIPPNASATPPLAPSTL